MELNYRPSESNVRPVEIEKSKRTVFLRKDIVEGERDGSVWYTYQEAKLSHEEFEKYASFMNAKNIINIANGQTIGDTNQLIIMEALADLYDAIAKLS